MTEKSGVDPAFGYIDDRVKSLKATITRLSNRIESLGLSGLQDQISRLSDEVKSINKDLIAVSRVVAFNEIDALDLHMQGAINNKLPADDPNKIRLTEYISVESAKAIENNKNSSTPLDTLKAFKKECMACSKEYNLGAFRVKPY